LRCSGDLTVFKKLNLKNCNIKIPAQRIHRL
jgi:hypothetical protein